MKKILAVIGAIAAVVILGLGMYHSDATSKNKLLSDNEIEDLVRSQYPGDITKMELNDDYSNSFYKVAIKGDQAEYELKMDAKSGEVLKLKETKTLTAQNDSSQDEDKDTVSEKQQEKNKKEIDKKNEKSEEKEDNEKDKQHQSKNNDEKQNNDNNQNQKENQNQQKENDSHNHQNKEQDDNNSSKEQQREIEKKEKTVISREEAIKIALNQFSGEVDDVDLEEEDGRLIYEIEIERGDLEAEIEIDAYSGEVIIMEIDD